MHLLATMPGTIADGTAAVDLAQTPGDIVVLSSADTEFALLAAAQQRRRAQDPAAPTPAPRADPAARPQFLGRPLHGDGRRGAAGRRPHPRRQRLLALWRRAAGRNLPRAAAFRWRCLPGDDKPDRELAEFSTAQPQASRRLWRYLAEGGPGNAENFLRYAGSLIGREARLGRARAAVARRALLARSRRCRASPISPREWRGERRRSCRSCSTGHWCSRGTPRRSMRWSRR